MTWREASPAGGVPRGSSPESPSGRTSFWKTRDTSSDEAPAELQIPAGIPILSRKNITKGALLGSGAFGNAYKGSLRLSDGTEATVAIKEYPALSGAWNTILEEACMLRDVAGIAGAPRLHGVIAEEESLTLVMEFCQGRTFCDFVSEANRARASLAMQMIEKAVEDLHQAGFAHCDLHGCNIIVDDTSSALNIRFIDFGLAKKLSKNEAEDEYQKILDSVSLWRLASPIPKESAVSSDTFEEEIY